MSPRLEIAPGCFRDPESNVVSLHSIDDAWQRYCALVEAQRNDQHLLTDMEHQKQLALAYANWRRLFLATEHAG